MATSQRAKTAQAKNKQSNGHGSARAASERIASTKSAGASRSSGPSGSSKQASRATKARSRKGAASNAKGNGSGKGTASGKGTPQTRGRDASSQSSASRGSDSQTRNGRATNAEQNGSGALKNVGISVATGTLGAAAGIAGGVLLGRTVGKRQRKVLGVKLPGQGADLSTVARGLKDAGKQFGKLAGEVREARKTVAQVGKALS